MTDVGSLPNHLQQGALSAIPEEAQLLHENDVCLWSVVLHCWGCVHTHLHHHSHHYNLVWRVSHCRVLLGGAGPDSLLCSNPAVSLDFFFQSAHPTFTSTQSPCNLIMLNDLLPAISGEQVHNSHFSDCCPTFLGVHMKVKQRLSIEDCIFLLRLHSRESLQLSPEQAVSVCGCPVIP